jgi:signal transduction histidine kinase
MSVQQVPELRPAYSRRRKRGDQRFLVNQPARLSIPGTTGMVWEARIRDISRRGMQFELDRPVPGSLIRIEWNGQAIHATIRYQQPEGNGYRLGVELTANWDSLVTEVLAEQARELEAANRALDRALHEAREANAVKSRFLASVSHELRTPLNGIIGFAQMLHDGRIGAITEDQRDCLADILACSEHLLKLIGHILDLAAVESGKMAFHYETVSLAQLAGEVAETVRPMAQAKQISIDVRADPRLAAVEADTARLKQVLYNYLSNALKFTPAGGTIQMSVAPQNTANYRIDVEDTGPGIAEEDLPRLFSEFSQLEAGRQSLGGTGLGLAITKRIVESQGGRVGVESKVGKGSRFWAVLPVQPGAKR